MNKSKHASVFLAILIPTIMFFSQIRSGLSEVFAFRNKSQVLSAIPNNPSVLINVRGSLFPATWDITLLGQQATKALQKGLLGNTQHDIRWKCAQILTQLRDPSARNTLHKALGDWSPKVRKQALKALAELGNHETAPHIIKRFKQESEVSNRIQALDTLGKLGDPRAAELIKATFQGNPKNKAMRRAAIQAFWALRRSLKKERLLAFMRTAIQDKDSLVVRKAAIALGELKDKEALPKLEKMLGSSSRMLRNVAAYVLGQIGDPKGIKLLTQALPSVRSGRLLNNISFALQRLKDKKLQQRLQQFLQHQQAFIRLNSAYTVGEMKLKSARPHLEKLLKDPNLLVRNQAMIALAKVEDKAAIPALLQAIKNNTKQQKWLATLAVLYLSDGKQFKELLFKQVMNSKSRSEKSKSALLLAHFGDQRAVPYLFYLLKWSYSRSYWQAAKKLNNPALNQLLLGRLKLRLKKNNTSQLRQLLEFAGPTEVKALRRSLLGLVMYKWYKPFQRSYRKYRYRNKYLYRRQRQSRNSKKENKQGPVAFWGKNYKNTNLQASLKMLGQTNAKELKLWIRYFSNHRNYHIRTEALVALAQLGDKSAFKNLLSEFKFASDRHRPFLVKKLSRLSKTQLQRSLLALLKHDDLYLRYATAGLLLLSGDKSVSKVLLQGLKQPQQALRKRAQFYLRVGKKKVKKNFFVGLAKKAKDDTAKQFLETLKDEVMNQQKAPSFNLFQRKRVRMK